MEQTPSSPAKSPELPSVAPPSPGEMGGTLPSPETYTGGQVERGEATPAAEQTSAPSAVLPMPVVVVPVADDAATSASPVSDDLPTVANDDDLIEKEWVNKTKKVIAETKDDPYRREQEVTRIQADYLSKRYGRELGSPSEG